MRSIGHGVSIFVTSNMDVDGYIVVVTHQISILADEALVFVFMDVHNFGCQHLRQFW
jgi:hypothetical protein